MKVLFSTFLFVIISLSTFAMCGDRGITVFPQSKEIKQNSWFMLEGFSESQEIINKLNLDYPVYLEAKGHKVKLIIVNKYVGQYNLTQAILKPAEKLIAGKEYVLKIDNLVEYEKEDILRLKGDKLEPISWKVIKGTDKAIPEWKIAPSYAESICMHFGCGPELFVLFNCEINDDSEVLVKTKFTNLKTNKTTIYYLIAKDNIIEVGHDMCAGAFDFPDYGEDKGFSASFALLDASGNENNNYSKAIVFPNPYKEFEIDFTNETDNDIETNPIVERINLQGIYMHESGKQFWSVYFDKLNEKFVATLYDFEKGTLEYYETYTITGISSNTAPGTYNIQMEGISGEMVPNWNITYNDKKECFDLRFYTYDVEKDEWKTIIYNGNNINEE